MTIDIRDREHIPDALPGPNKTYRQDPDIPNGEISLVFRRHSSGKTFMAKQFSRTPMQVMKEHYYDVDGTAFVYSLNPAGGVLQHDYLRTEIVCEAGTDAVFTTPGNTKFYRMDEGRARVENKLVVLSGGVLEYLPEHNVPFAGARVFQENQFHVQRGGVLFATDIVTSGRAANGERFLYDVYQSRTSIYVDGELVLYDNCRLEPASDDLSAMGLLDGRLINGSFYVYADDMEPTLKDQVGALSSDLVRLAAGNITDSLMVVRFLGDEVMDVAALVQDVWDICRKSILGKPAVRLRKEYSPLSSPDIPRADRLTHCLKG